MVAGLAAALLLGASMALASPVRAVELETLIGGAAQTERRTVAYEETRTIAGVTKPLLSRGRLIYEPGGRLIKKIETPRRETAILEEDRLTILDADDTEVATIDLWMQRDLQLVFTGLQAVFSGDAAALRKAFDIRISGDTGRWRIRLTPKPDDGDLRLESVIVSGSERQIADFEVRERGGDTAVIRLLDAAPRR
jgi:hypothetical protein